MPFHRTTFGQPFGLMRCPDRGRSATHSLPKVPPHIILSFYRTVPASSREGKCGERCQGTQVRCRVRKSIAPFSEKRRTTLTATKCVRLRSMDQEKLPLSWNNALLAIIPGLMATAGLISTDFSTRMFLGLILLILFLVSIYWWNNKQLPGWSLMAAGMLASVGLMIASGVIGGLAAIVAGKSANTIVFLILLVTLITLLGFSGRNRPVSRLAWILIALIIMCQLAVRIKYFFQLGVSWSVAGQWLNISLYSAVVVLLLPAVLGQLLANRYGRLTMLFVIGMIYVGFQILIDVNFKVSDQIGGTLGFVAYKALIPFFFTVAAPLWFLRAHSSLSRKGGMLALVGLAVMIDLLVIGLSYRGELPLIIWISFIPYTISVLLTLILAYLLCQKGNRTLISVCS